MYKRQVQYLSISSSDFPVVSGTSFHTMSIYGTHMTANRKNVTAGVRFWSIQGVNCPIRYVPIHRANPAMDIASPRTLVAVSYTHLDVYKRQHILIYRRIRNCVDNSFFVHIRT